MGIIIARREFGVRLAMGVIPAPLGIEQRLLILAAAMQAQSFTRRYFVSYLGGMAAWPLTASAQPAGGKIVTIGILGFEPWPPIDTFRQALDDLGYIEGKNVRFEYRYAKGHNERLPELANDLVGLNVDVILAWGTDAVLAAKQATTTIPIVMAAVGDPVDSGIVTNLARPGANVTGCSLRSAELEAKRLQPLKEVVPALSRVAILFNSTNHYMPLALQSAQSTPAEDLGLRNPCR